MIGIYIILLQSVNFSRSWIVFHHHFFFCFLTDYSGSSGSGAVILDDCNFHESVHLDSFDVDRTLSLVSGRRLCYSESQISEYTCLNPSLVKQMPHVLYISGAA